MKVILSKDIFKVKTEDKEEANVIKFFQLNAYNFVTTKVFFYSI